MWKCVCWQCFVVCPQWKSLSEKEKAKYFHQANKERQLHAQKYPYWSSNDNYVCNLFSRMFTSLHQSWWNTVKDSCVQKLTSVKSLMCLFLCRAKRERGRGAKLPSGLKVRQYFCGSQCVFRGNVMKLDDMWHMVIFDQVRSQIVKIQRFHTLSLKTLVKVNTFEFY